MCGRGHLCTLTGTETKFHDLIPLPLLLTPFTKFTQELPSKGWDRVTSQEGVWTIVGGFTIQA